MRPGPMLSAGLQFAAAGLADRGCTLPRHLRVRCEKGGSTCGRPMRPIAIAVDPRLPLAFDH